MGKIENNKKPVYICDGKLWCRSTEDCYMNGGSCNHTKQIEHAKNFREWGNSYEESAARIKPAAPLTIIIFALMLLNLLQFLQCRYLSKAQ